ncbi:hypothetical protein BDQ94DRAFT_157897 [Aspergillus welwitschiae]|uniref:Uncharacterized protein n=1 Tax=Aspergillus welwitschiae TaxID=1341132 RepID=A0A3F3Q990_9EURO|nr:hypothetical protein BDQ94DRAFT_157897 [Aspergillus welwitschiae]RDH35695.1 hypothetical protein BDQ94DRAFT_157897 [Aspergillus welwitschiae]
MRQIEAIDSTGIKESKTCNYSRRMRTAVALQLMFLPEVPRLLSSMIRAVFGGYTTFVGLLRACQSLRVGLLVCLKRPWSLLLLTSCQDTLLGARSFHHRQGEDPKGFLNGPQCPTVGSARGLVLSLKRTQLFPILVDSRRSSEWQQLLTGESRGEQISNLRSSEADYRKLMGAEETPGSSAKESHGLFLPCGRRSRYTLCPVLSLLLRLISTSTRSGLPMGATGLSFPRPQSKTRLADHSMITGNSPFTFLVSPGPSCYLVSDSEFQITSSEQSPLAIFLQPQRFSPTRTQTNAAGGSFSAELVSFQMSMEQSFPEPFSRGHQRQQLKLNNSPNQYTSPSWGKFRLSSENRQTGVFPFSEVRWGFMAQLTLSWFVHAHEETQSRVQPYIDHIAHPRTSPVRSGSGSASHSLPSAASPTPGFNPSSWRMLETAVAPGVHLAFSLVNQPQHHGASSEACWRLNSRGCAWISSRINQSLGSATILFGTQGKYARGDLAETSIISAITLLCTPVRSPDHRGHMQDGGDVTQPAETSVKSLAYPQTTCYPLNARHSRQSEMSTSWAIDPGIGNTPQHGRGLKHGISELGEDE